MDGFNGVPLIPSICPGVLTPTGQDSLLLPLCTHLTPLMVWKDGKNPSLPSPSSKLRIMRLWNKDPRPLLRTPTHIHFLCTLRSSAPIYLLSIPSDLCIKRGGVLKGALMRPDHMGIIIPIMESLLFYCMVTHYYTGTLTVTSLLPGCI